MIPTTSPPPKMTLKPHTDFYKDYKMVSLLGEGGYGSVYLCLHQASQQHRAVKIMDGTRCHNTTWCDVRAEHLPNEIILWETCTHPNIVTLLDIYRDPEADAWFLVMEYLPGYLDLFEYIDQHGVLSDRESANIVRQLVRVVCYLTLNNIDHRDIKDENLLYNPSSGTIKLIDFGASGALNPKPYISYRGTEVYIPPEYYTAGSYYPLPAAVWSIGCLAYVLISGDCPFQSRDDVKSYTDLNTLNPSLAKRTLRLNFLRRCLDPRPSERILLSDLLRHPWLKC